MARTKKRDGVSATEEVARKVGVRRQTKRVGRRKLDPNMLVPSGSTLLNLAMSDTIWGGPKLGTMINVIGDSSAGKTFKEITMLAEACLLPRFDGYRMIYDDGEEANCFDMEYLFGPTAAERVTSPAEDEDGKPINSHYIEDLNNNLMNLFERHEPFIYIQDSFDSLDTEADDKKTEEMRDARNKGNQSKGDYGTVKPKLASRYLRKITAELEKSKSLLSIVSQTRDNINPKTMSTKTRSGGRALKFYATHEMWLAVGGKIYKTVNGEKKIIGVHCVVKVSKNKLTGKVREVQFPIYYDYGIDDIGSCIDFLIKEKAWTTGKSKGTKISTQGTFTLDGMTRAKMIETVEAENIEKELKILVGKEWEKIEEALRVHRKPKYK